MNFIDILKQAKFTEKVGPDMAGADEGSMVATVEDAEIGVFYVLVASPKGNIQIETIDQQGELKGWLRLEVVDTYQDPQIGIEV